jgi:hypothetical protein
MAKRRQVARPKGPSPARSAGPQMPQQNRMAQMRQNNRNVSTFQPGPQQGFQGGVGLNRTISEPLPGIQTSGDVPVNDPNANRRTPCPPGMTAGKDPNTGASTCVPTAARPKGPKMNMPNSNKNNRGY